MLDTIDCLTVDLGMSRYLLENVGGGGGGVREEEDWVKQNSKSGWIFWIQWRRGKSRYA